jgi:hypothetical protein
MEYDKSKLRTAIFDFFKSKGHPNLTAEQILTLLPDCYRHLEDLLLVPPGVSFALFQKAAMQSKVFSELARL